MTGNVAFMFVCTIMVFFMTPGLAFFYGGMVRRKNALNTMMFCMAMMGIGMLLWFLCGYSLSFGKDHAGIIGDLNNVLMRNVSWEVTGGEGDAPEMVSALFNMMFAVISPAIILGAVAERMKFSKMILFVVIWSFLVYYPLAHMAWGGGLLEMIGSIDFAGGNVIHISTGVSGLTAAGKATEPCPTTRTTYRCFCWEPPCCGWAGSASTAAVPVVPTVLPFWRLPIQHFPPPQAWWYGCSSKHWCRKSAPSWVP